MGKPKQSRSRKQEYFVVHLNPSHSQYKAEERIFQIQILDSSGRAAFSGYIGETEHELLVEGHVVPYAVLEAARRQPEGKGDYVNDKGESLPPY